MKAYIALTFALGLLLVACDPRGEQELPVFGPKMVEKRMVDGKEVIDSVDYHVDSFALINQNEEAVTAATVDGKVYIVDFFFTSCPTICPKIKQQTLRVYEEFKEEEEFAILSHSIDTKYDTPERLSSFAKKLGVNLNSNWHFLTGDKTHIYNLAETYMVTVMEDEDAPGGYAHSGAVLLVDRQGRIRGQYDGTDPAEMAMLIRDVKRIL